MAVHELKTHELYWDAIAERRKTFELRFNDRAYQTGDTLRLVRWSAEHHCKTAPYEPIIATVAYVMHGGLFGLKDNWVCMALTAVNVPRCAEDADGIDD